MADTIVRYTVLRDTSEKAGNGWVFEAEKECLGTEPANLYTGDYTLKGLEKEFVIERKANTGEFAKNVNEPRWKDELDRLHEFRWPFVVCEFTMDDILRFPEGSGIPQNRWHKLKTSPNFLLACILQIGVRWNTRVILAGGAGKRVALSLFRRVMMSRD